MGRRKSINILLLALVLILGSLVWLTPKKNGDKEFVPLTNLNPSAVNRINIHNRNGEFSLQREGEDWKMTAPYRIAANLPRINILLDIVSTPSFEQHPLPREHLEKFGLDPPKARLQLNESQLIFGGTHPYNFRRYIRINDTLHLTSDHFPHHLLASAEEFISHKLIRSGGKISEIGTAEWRLFKNPNGTWNLQPPVAGLSSDRLQKKIDNWRNALASRVEKAPAEVPETHVEILLKDETTPVVFGVLRKKNDLLLIRSDLGIAYRVHVAADLLRSPAVSTIR